MEEIIVNLIIVILTEQDKLPRIVYRGHLFCN